MLNFHYVIKQNFDWFSRMTISDLTFRLLEEQITDNDQLITLRIIKVINQLLNLHSFKEFENFNIWLMLKFFVSKLFI